jgi:ribose transport system ATP-binding protein
MTKATSVIVSTMNRNDEDGPALEMTTVSKSFGAVQVLKNASLVCYPGEVHALVGENGAGKSTLIKLASGMLKPDSGTIRIGGVELKHASAIAARKLGLLTGYQDTSLVPELTAAENLVLSFHGHERARRVLPFAGISEIFRRYELPFAPGVTVAELSPASRQLLEVVRTLIHRPKLLLLDEPTAALDVESTARLEALIGEAIGEGTAILYVSHRLDEVRRLANRLTVLRDGEIQGTYDGRTWSVTEIVSEMVGVAVELEFPEKPSTPPASDRVLAVDKLNGEGFGPISLDVRRGEIVGIAGAEGNGQRELLRAIVGLRKSRGELSIKGSPVKIANPAVAARHGMTFLSGDRAAESVFRQLSVMENSVQGMGRELGPAGLFMRSHALSTFEPVADDLNIVRSSSDQPAGELSGGNQQKTVLARALLSDADIWVVDEPTQGVDARARLDIYRVLRERVRGGAAVLVNSSDSAELAGLCDRVYVLSRGLVVRELEGDELEESRIVESFVDVLRDDVDVMPADVAGIEEIKAVVARRPKPWASFSVPPMAVLVALLALVMIYTATQSGVFLGKANLTSWLIPAIPLAVLAIGLQATLLTGEFDISTGSTMSLSVVLASYWATSNGFAGTIPGIIGIVLLGVVVGLLNSFVVRVLKVGAIIGTIGTLGVIAGVSILLRPTPGGVISLGLSNALSKQVGFVPVALIVIAVVAVAADLWRVRTFAGLSVRAVGHAEEAARRTGMRVTTVKVVSYVITDVLAVIAGIFLATQLGAGSNDAGVTFPLLGFTACFLGGAALTGGRGSFVGAVIGALFLTLLVNITPLLTINTAWSQIATGVLTVLAVTAYSIKRTGGGRFGRGAAPPADVALSGPIGKSEV